MSPPRGSGIIPTWLFQSPANSGANDGAMPLAYDINWQRYTNLTADQIQWFQAQPEWQNFLTYVVLSPQTATVATPVAVVNGVLQVHGQVIATKPIVV